MELPAISVAPAFRRDRSTCASASCRPGNYSTKDDTLKADSDPEYGYSHDTLKTLLFSWNSNDTMPQPEKDPQKV
jgi:hypothetical protein